jgi:hypothetical protein
MKFRPWWEAKVDGDGVSASSPEEKRDCVVRALALLCRSSYEDALELCALYGRKRNKGMRARDMIALPTFKFNGCTFREVKLWRPVTCGQWKGEERQWKTVGSFVKAHPKGRYMLRVAGHVMPLVDGVVTDWRNRPRRRLTWAFEVTEGA